MPAKKATPSAKKRKRATTPKADSAQSARFVEMAKKLEADESGEQFEHAIGVLIPKKK